MKLKASFYCLLFAAVSLCAQDVTPAGELSQLTSLSSELNSAINASRTQTQTLLSKLDSVESRLILSDLNLQTSEKSLKLSQTELIELRISLADTRTSFTVSSAALEKANQELARERERVRSRNKALLWLGMAGGAIVLAKVAAFVLYAKRVPTPRWLDIIL